MSRGPLTRQLLGLLGEEGLVKFCQAFGGTRLYIPHKMSDEHEIVQVVGRELADKLNRRMAPCNIRVPLARRERALFYRRQGLSDARIARQLGITENGVGKLFNREEDLPDRPGKSSNPAQLALF
jgi:hypothetical protein